jgi:hypothetical protein
VHPVTIVILVVVVLVLLAVPLVAGRRGVAGYERIVRCHAGHLFTSTVVPGASLKAVRLGFARFQRCPVGRHWTLVRTVDEASLTPQELEAAQSVHDAPLP